MNDKIQDNEGDDEKALTARKIKSVILLISWFAHLLEYDTRHTFWNVATIYFINIVEMGAQTSSHFKFIFSTMMMFKCNLIFSKKITTRTFWSSMISKQCNYKLNYIYKTTASWTTRGVENVLNPVRTFLIGKELSLQPIGFTFVFQSISFFNKFVYPLQLPYT